MATKVFPLESVRTDGWLERIGEGIGSFQALCEIVGERFFAFSIIVGARITSLTVDKRNQDMTLVDFVVGPDDAVTDTQRLTLAEFRRRLVGALLIEENEEPPQPTRETDVEGIQLFIGARYLLLAPIYGYSLRELQAGKESTILASHDGADVRWTLDEFRSRIRGHVRDELDRIATGSRSAIDLQKVSEAEAFAAKNEWSKVVQLLGSWPAPLAIFLRTPEGQALAPDARGLIAKGLGLLGTACVRLGETDQAEEVFRIGIQYAQEGPAGADLFERMGQALLEVGRSGEAIGPLRRAVVLGGPTVRVLPLLGKAFTERNRLVAALACYEQASRAGSSDPEVKAALEKLRKALPTLSST